MKNLTLTIIAIIFLILQSLSMVKAFFILKELILDANNKSLISQQDKMFLLAAFLIWIFVSIVFIILIFKVLAKKEKNVIEVPSKNKVNASKEKKKRLEDEQKNLLETERKSNETVKSIINGLNTNLNLKDYSDKLLSNLSKQYELVQGMVFTRSKQDIFQKSGTYAFYQEDEAQDFKEGVGIAGQVAINKELINISNLPEKYLTVLSGLGNSSPTNLIIFPVLFENKVIGIVELATFVKMDKFAEQVLMVLSSKIGEHLSQIIKV